MKPIVITAGDPFTDIDVLGCAVPYSELLTLEGKDNEVVLPGFFNSSITPTVRNWGLKYLTKPTEENSSVVIVDVSEPSYVSKFVKEEQIIELYDHRFGFQDLWKSKLGENAHIELVGACATLIWEQYKKRGFADKISSLSANLISIAILSNTLNFGASVTTERDIIAFEELKKYIDMSSNWQETYFSDVEEDVFKDIKQAIVSDTKTLNIPGINFPIVMGQLELWNGNEFLSKNKEEAKRALETFDQPDWFLSIPSISEKKNYIYTESKKVKELLPKIITITFTGDIGVTDKLWLRKEIRKKLLELK